MPAYVIVEIDVIDPVGYIANRAKCGTAQRGQT